VPVALTILGSGSAGNCAYLESGETRLLIDAGLSARQIRLRLASLGRAVETLTGILISHEHTDHIQGLCVLAAKLDIPIYCNRLTKEAIEYQLKIRLASRLFSTGASFAVGDMLAETFSVPHDAQDPVGFLLQTPAGNFGFLTDLGHATRLVIERVRSAQVLLLEANHDLKMLQDDTRRPWGVKQRILSRHGHLSNDAAAEAAAQIASARMQRLYLGHLSRDCNRPELAQRAVQARLQTLGALHIKIATVSQDVPSPTLTLPAETDSSPAIDSPDSGGLNLMKTAPAEPVPCPD